MIFIHIAFWNAILSWFITARWLYNTYWDQPLIVICPVQNFIYQDNLPHSPRNQRSPVSALASHSAYSWHSFCSSRSRPAQPRLAPVFHSWLTNANDNVYNKPRKPIQQSINPWQYECDEWFEFIIALNQALLVNKWDVINRKWFCTVLTFFAVK